MQRCVEGACEGLLMHPASELQVRMDERHRISRELHDGTSQLLVALQLNLLVLKEELKGQRYNALIAEIGEAIATLHHEVRGIAAASPKPLFAADDLPAALKSMAESFGRLGHLNVVVEVDRPFVPQPAAVEAAVYRITQEALANARRHGSASQVRIWLSSSGSALSLTIEDNGVGIDPNANHGAGLTNIGNRVTELGGTFSIHSVVSGTCLKISMGDQCQ